jgi:hypothetical protein
MSSTPTITSIISDTDIADISGIIIFYETNESGNLWESDDSPGTYTISDISNVSDSRVFFLPYSSDILLVLTGATTGPNDIIRFYLVPTANVSSFNTGNPINITGIKSLLYNGGDTYVEIGQNYMNDPLTPLTLITTTIAESSLNTTSTLPILSSYTPAQVNSLFDTRDTSLRVVETKSEQTIAAEVKTYLGANGRLPQFKNYGDYLAYKKAINLQNGLLQRYG